MDTQVTRNPMAEQWDQWEGKSTPCWGELVHSKVVCTPKLHASLSCCPAALSDMTPTLPCYCTGPTGAPSEVLLPCAT